ncbi:tRNA (adenosine(37)-N6)-dimethylallyltransferase MiaA [Staphylococcus sp. SQ8-PEA]|uniref:tRNA dimethylallyltransferase n=1 Tax=Staphylococcus marylandisciuri TaxID=2981529 RepID=A0ABT2QS47_9STAP|nr:tRNA (adenosine(37)-N6)-dimethylallyltransferase MiaA [Staphylococcus marylandisciuri]MCU5746783.1 tRNA (adenosine(37)-N6)-dimethylallyltransferase MiaA [Staphylococcus marylandisciuri]
MRRKKPLLIVIVGPTAVGKTELSINLAQQVNGEIISGDSMQVYKGMDIGTAKASIEERKEIPHYMIDILNPDDTFSAFDFKVRAERYINDITAKGKVPIIVGGTGLYIQSLIYDYQFENEDLPRERQIKVNRKMEELSNYDCNQLHQYLKSFDPKSAEQIHPNNRQRTERAIEYYFKTKKLLSSRKKIQHMSENYDTLLIGMEMSRDILYERINKRVDIMLTHGLLNEVNGLVRQGYENCQSMQAIGYKEIVPVVKGNETLEEATIKLKRNSRRYAKRQMTWFKNQLNVVWYDREKTSLNSMVNEVSARIKQRSKNHDNN